MLIGLWWNPLVWILAMLGYIAMFVIASLVAPKVANKLSGKFSLHASMIILFLTILFVFVSSLLGIAYGVLVAIGVQANTSNMMALLSSLVIPMIIFVVAMNLIVYLISPYIINLTYGATRDDRLQEIVNKAATKLGLSKPPKAVVVRGPPNAFAYGNILAGRYVAVSEEMIRLTNEEELEAVVGHEIGHHLHKDNMIMLFLGILPSVIYYLGITLINSGLYSTGYSSNRRNDSGGLILVATGVVAVMISFLLQILILAFSRLREYFADYEGARAAGRKAMQRSLAKLHLYYRSSGRAKETIARSNLKTLFIYALTEALANPFYSVSDETIERIKRTGYTSLEEIFATHPPIPKRLRALDQYIELSE
ncbi:MAG: zinc metalloprotease HtpX [Sulfolobales archaeon]